MPFWKYLVLHWPPLKANFKEIDFFLSYHCIGSFGGVIFLRHKIRFCLGHCIVLELFDFALTPFEDIGFCDGPCICLILG